MKENFLSEVERKMHDLIKTKEDELDAINLKVAELNREAEDTKKGMEDATAIMNIDAYTDHFLRLAMVRAAVEMYEKRRLQLLNQEMITEAESDVMIDSVLAYEDEIRLKFEQEAADILGKLSEVKRTYDAQWKAAEAFLREWTSSVHPNYRFKGSAYQDGTNRADHPVPVHRVAYNGGAANARIGEFLDAAESWK